MAYEQHLEEGNNMAMMIGHKQVSNSEGGDWFDWEVATLYEKGKCLAKVVIAGKRPFDEFGVGVHMVKELLGVTVWGFILGGAMRVGIAFIEDTTVMYKSVVSGEAGHDSGEGEYGIYVVKL